MLIYMFDLKSNDTVGFSIKCKKFPSLLIEYTKIYFSILLFNFYYFYTI